MRFKRVIHTVDSHTEGNPTRVILGGVGNPPGASVGEKAGWLFANDDGLRRMLNFEPRGNDMMCSVLLLPPLSAEAHFAAVIMEQDEYVPMCGHCVIGAATTVVSLGMVPAMEPTMPVRFDTHAGLVACDVHVRHGRVQGVSLTNVWSFLLHRRAGVEVEGLGRVAVDVAFGGDWYVIADADAIGLELKVDRDEELIAAANRIIPAVNAQLAVRHPERPEIDRVYEMLFTSGRTSTGDYKQTIVSPPGDLDRSPCGGGTCARVALLHTIGELPLRRPARFEGPLGTVFTGEAVAAERRAGVLWVRPRITGRAYITGMHQFILDRADPLPAGFRIGPPPRAAPGFEGAGMPGRG